MNGKPEKSRLKKRKKSEKEILEEILKISEDMHNISDIDILLDKILYEARKFTNAEGGTIFLLEDGVLKIRYTQNEVLFSNKPENKYKYIDREIPVDSYSIAGCTAEKAKVIKFKDVYKINEKNICGFNRELDLLMGYRTKSIISVPLKTMRNNVIGVMQVINARDEKGLIESFSANEELFIAYLSNDAAVAIEKAIMTRDMVLRMLKMVEFRDPKETGGHVNRMGSYAIEIYHQWAKNRGFPPELIRRFKDKFRIAAMLHDVGKIGISDRILKKPGKLEEDEFEAMKMHPVLGYRLFADSTSEIDAMAAEVALHHHERWDGKGYPGKVSDLMNAEKFEFGPGKSALETPVTGRIVAIADVYGALSSKRIYKDAWPEDRVLDYIKESSGSHFDPEIVDAFFDVYDIINTIRDKYAEPIS